MRAAFVTILPMLAAAILVMVGGERMARREIENRTPADRERVLDLAETFRVEVARLDALYSRHLEQLSFSAVLGRPEATSATASEIQGVRLIRIFRARGQDSTISPSMNTGALPEIELSGRKRPLDPSKAVVLDAALLNPAPTPDSSSPPVISPSPFPIWQQVGTTDFQVYCSQPEAGVLVAILIDMARVEEVTMSHLSKWIAGPIVPLDEAGERIRIEGPREKPFLSIGPEKHGPAASIIPVRSLSGHWQIRAWDGLTLTRSHDAATLSAAAVLAALLAGSGVALFLQQKRAIRLAAERVSFVNRVSHELGTPLTNLTLNLDLATEALATRPAEARRRLDIVSEEIGRLSRIVANVLTFSRHERDTLRLKPVRCLPRDVILRTMESFRPALERKGIEIEMEIDGDAPVLLDPDALSQIIGNLVSNVEKYAASGRWFRLDAHLEDSFLTVEARDRGPGIPAPDRERIFVPFERVTDSTREGASGTGLGLSIGSDLARRMGGTLELVGNSSETVFRLRVPAPPALSVVTRDSTAA